MTRHHHARAAAWFVFTADVLATLLWAAFGVALLTSLWWMPPGRPPAAPNLDLAEWLAQVICALLVGPLCILVAVRLSMIARWSVRQARLNKMTEPNQGEHL